MPEFAYLNARVRAMRARLLSPASMARLSAAPGMERFLAELARTDYGRGLATRRGHPYECLKAALREDCLATFGHLRRLCAKQEAALAEAVFAGFDVANAVAVFRGVTAGAPAERTLEAVVAFEPREADSLSVAAAASSIAEAAQALSRGRHPVARTVTSLMERRPGAGLWEIEAVLAAWHFRVVGKWTEASDGHGALQVALRLDADLAKVLLALRLSSEPQARDELTARLRSPDVEALFTTPGDVASSLLARAAAQPSVAAASAVLRDTRFASALTDATDILTSERALREYRRHRLAALAAADPLGPGTLVGYLAAKEWEVAQLRRIGFRLARGATDAPGPAA